MRQMAGSFAHVRRHFRPPMARDLPNLGPVKAWLMLDLWSACARLFISTCAEITNEFAGLILGGKE
jgi:hypothetical protein